MSPTRPVCVVGLGLIGGSVLRAAARAGRRAWGATASGADATAARDDGFDAGTGIEAALLRAAAEDALVVLAVPLPAVPEVLRLVAEHAPQCRLTDVVGVKAPVADGVARLAPCTRYVGGHPMAGATSSGWSAGSAGLFDGAAWTVAADDGLDVQVWADVAALALDCGAHVVPATAAGHDAAVARVSHLPHLLAAVLASVGAEGGPLALALAAGSFRDGTRTAGSPPELVRAMCEGNRGPLLDAVDDALGRLGVARGSLASTGSLAATVQRGHEARHALDARTSKHIGLAEALRWLDGPEGLRLLRELGESGGRITLA